MRVVYLTQIQPCTYDGGGGECSFNLHMRDIYIGITLPSLEGPIPSTVTKAIV